MNYLLNKCVNKYILTNAGQRLITINRIQNKRYIYIYIYTIYVCTLTHTYSIYFDIYIDIYIDIHIIYIIYTYI